MYVSQGLGTTQFMISIYFSINHAKEKKTHKTLEIYDNLKTKDNNFKGGNGKEGYIEAGTICFLTIYSTSYKLWGQHEILIKNVLF